MAAAWSGAARELVVDPDARTTVGNAANALDDIRRVGAREVVVVTSRWHAPRAKAAFRLLLVEPADPASRPRSRPSRATFARSLRELPLWLLLPAQLWQRAAHPARQAGGPAPGSAQPAGASKRCRAQRYAPSPLAHLDVDPVLRLAQRAAAATRPHGEDLGQDRERRLLLRVGADVEAARAHDPGELLLRHARLEQAPAAPLGRAARAQRADVEGLARERRLQRRLVELVVVGENDDGSLVIRARARRSPPRATSGSARRPRASARRSGTSRGRRRRSPSSRAAWRPGRATPPCRPRRRRTGEAAARTTRRTPSSRRRARAACCGLAARARRTGRSRRRARRRRSARPSRGRAPCPRRRHPPPP